MMRQSIWAVAFVLSACNTKGERVSARSSALAEVDQAEMEVEVEVEPGALGAEAARVTRVELAREGDDLDGDGFASDVDPADDDARVFPDAPEVPCNGIDEDGDHADSCPPDEDGDGSTSDIDCDDTRPEIHRLAVEVRCNGLDENCDGWDDCDRDGDGTLDRDDLAPDDPSFDVPRRETPRDAVE